MKIILVSLITIFLFSCSSKSKNEGRNVASNANYSDLPLTIRCYSYPENSKSDTTIGKWKSVKEEDGSKFSYTDLKVNKLWHFMSHFEEKGSKTYMVNKFIANGDPTPLLVIKEKVDTNLSSGEYMSSTYPEYHFRGFVIKCALTKMQVY